MALATLRTPALLESRDGNRPDELLPVGTEVEAIGISAGHYVVIVDDDFPDFRREGILFTEDLEWEPAVVGGAPRF